MPYSDYNRYVAGGLGSIAEALQKKWQSEYDEQQFQQGLKNFLTQPGYQSTIPSLQSRPTGTVGDASGRLQPMLRTPRELVAPEQLPSLQYNEAIPRENPFEQGNLQNLLSFASSPRGAAALQQLLAIQPKHTVQDYGYEDTGLRQITQQLGQEPQVKDLRAPQTRPISQNQLGRFWSPTGNREKFGNREGEWYEEFYEGTKTPTGGREWRGYGSESTGGAGGGVIVIPTNQGLMFVDKKNRTVSPVERAGEQLGKPPSGEMITQTTQIGGLKESLDRVKQAYKPDYVGSVSGRIATAKEATVGVPEEQAQFYSNLADIQNTLIYLKSGKQINENEYQRLLKQLPDRNNPEPVFNARMKEFERVLNNIISTREKTSAGYGGLETPVSSQPQKTVVKKFVSKSTGKTKYIYSDGTEEIK